MINNSNAGVRKMSCGGDLYNLYLDVFLRREGFCEDGCRRFGTSPVEGAYWMFSGDIDPKLLKHPIPEGVRGLFNGRSIQEGGSTVVFRRFESLMPEEERRYHELDILVKSFLGFPEYVDCRISKNSAILNDDWLINLRWKEETDVMTDAFLKKVEGMLDELNKGVENSHIEGKNITGELNDLLRIYTDAEGVLKRKEEELLRMLTSYMKRYVEAQAEREKVTEKLTVLKVKIFKPACQDCGDEHGEDE